MGDDIRAPFNRPAVDGSGESVVNNERHAVTVRSIRELFDVEDGQGGVGDGFAENRPGVGAESRVELFHGAVRGKEGEIHSHFPHGDGKEIVGAAVNRGRGDHMVPGSGNIENGKEVRSLAG